MVEAVDWATCIGAGIEGDGLDKVSRLDETCGEVEGIEPWLGSRSCGGAIGWISKGTVRESELSCRLVKGKQSS